jgi:hypothetical protein
LLNAATSAPELSEEAKAAAVIAEFAIRQLNLTGSAQLGMITTLAKHYAPALLQQLPVYAIDAPPSSIVGSSRLTKSATELLHEIGSTLSARVFNVLAEAKGFLEKQQRKSTSKKGVKEFWTVTEAGLAYGKNVTSPSNPKETQPHWYVESFNELVEIITE